MSVPPPYTSRKFEKRQKQKDAAFKARVTENLIKHRQQREKKRASTH
jgi:hypothetical protein